MGTPPTGGGNLGDPNLPNESRATGVPTNQPNLGPLQDTLNTMAESSLRMAETMDRVFGYLEKMAQATAAVNDNLKEGVSQADDLAGSIKASINAAKDFNNNIKGQKRTYEEIAAHAQRMIQANKQMLENTKGNTAATKTLQSNMKTLEKTYEDAARKAKEHKANTVASDDAMKGYSQTLMGVTRNMSALAAAQGKLASTRLEQHVIALNRAYRDAGMQVKVYERLEEQFARNRALREIREAKVAHAQGKRQDVQDLMARAGGAAAAHLGVDLARTPTGAVDWAKMRARGPVTGAAARAVQEMDYGAAAKEVAYRGGQGFLGRADAFLSERALRARAAAQTGGAAGAPGAIGRAGVALSEMGGGSVLGGATEGGMGAMAELAGPAAAIYAIGKTIQKGWDTMAHTNAAIEKALGASIYTPGMTGGEALMNVRQNLSANLFNSFGQNLDKNLAIAQAMRESGLDISELTTQDLRSKTRLAGGGTADVESGFLGGTFGEFQRNVFTAGRSAGLTDSQTVVRMTKMITEMRQTFEATHDFLEGINTQARAAGISTTAYLGIVDNLNDKFSALNKSFGSTVSILQTLGATGTATAQDMKDMAEFITGTGETKTSEQNIFAFSQMGEGQKKRWVESQQAATDEAVTALKKGLTDSGKFTPDEIGRMDLTSGGGVLAAQNMIAGTTGLDATQKLNLKKLSDEAYAQYNQLGVAKEVQAGNIVGAGLGLQAIGQNAETRTQIQQRLLQTAMETATGTGRVNIGSLRRDPTQLLKIPEVLETLKALGEKPEDLEQAIRAAGGFQGGMLIEGAAQLKTKKEQDEEYQRILKAGHAAGVFQQLGPKATNEQIQAALKDRDTFAKVAQSLEDSMTPDEFAKAMHTTMLKVNQTAQDKQVQQVAIQTRDSADIFANAFEKFFTMLMQGITKLIHLIESIPGVGGGEDEVSPETAHMMDMLQASGAVQAAQGTLAEAAQTDQAAQDQYSQLKSYQLMKQNSPDAITEAQTQQVASIIRANAIAGFGTTGTDWGKVQGMANLAGDPKLLAEQAVRDVAAQAGGQFGNYDMTGETNRFYLGKNLQGEQLDALNALLKPSGMSVQYDKDAGKQYVQTNVTLNSTDVTALTNRYGTDTMRAPNNSGEVTNTGGAQIVPPLM